MKSIAILATVLSSTTSFAADYLEQQRPPLSIYASQECTHSDPSPVVSKKVYSPTEYTRTVTKKKPLKTVEELRLKNGTQVKIEQTGCEDMYGLITIDTKAGCKDSIECSIKALRSIKFEPEGFFFNAGSIKNIIKVIQTEKTNPAFKTKGTSIVCLGRAEPENRESECITDLKIERVAHGLKLTYVDRP